MDGKITNDPENYYKLSAPYESEDAADEAISKFYEELGELRKKHKIPDLLIVIKATVRHKDGKVGQMMGQYAYGSTLDHLAMAAYVYGQLQAEHKELINKLIVGKTK